jgi:hypothetical protein
MARPTLWQKQRKDVFPDKTMPATFNAGTMPLGQQRRPLLRSAADCCEAFAERRQPVAQRLPLNEKLLKKEGGES